MGGDGVQQEVRMAATAAARADRTERDRLLRLAHDGDPGALAVLWRRWRLHLPLAERRHRLPCLAGTCLVTDRGGRC